MSTKLTEAVFFSSQELNFIKKIVQKSNIRRLAVSSTEETKRVNDIITSLTKGITWKGNAYLLLKCAQYGPSDDSNYLLKYIRGLESTVWNTQDISEKVNYVIDNLVTHKLSIQNKTIPTYLLNKSLYSRSIKDFQYALKIFNAVLFEKDKYFQGRDEVTAELTKTQQQTFFPTLRDTTQATEYIQQSDGADLEGWDRYSKSSLTRLVEAEEVKSYTVPIDIRFFYDNCQESRNAQIIPAGINQSNENIRCIWNYVELWGNASENSSDTNEDDNEDDLASRRKVQRQVDSVKKKIEKSKEFSDEDKQEILSLLRRVLR